MYSTHVAEESSNHRQTYQPHLQWFYGEVSVIVVLIMKKMNCNWERGKVLVGFEEWGEKSLGHVLYMCML